MAPPDELVRVVRGTDGALLIGRHRPGRGAWLCAGSAACLEAAVRRRAFGRALRAEVGAEALAALRAHLAERASMGGSAGTMESRDRHDRQDGKADVRAERARQAGRVSASSPDGDGCGAQPHRKD